MSFLRDTNDLGLQLDGTGVSLASQGFTGADGSPGIVPLDPRGQSVENVVLNGYSFGAASSELLQVNNTYQARDSVSRLAGAHTFKAGCEFHADQVNDVPIAQFNGSFVFPVRKPATTLPTSCSACPASTTRVNWTRFRRATSTSGCLRKIAGTCVPT